ncbi:MAG: YihY/virulence factor BrkB family protein [bacterium]|nr:YihY/virulence factor BrkB family protein [bacterium]
MKAWLARIGRGAYEAIRNFIVDGCLDRAAAVAFYMLLSLGPLLYLMVAILGRVFHDGGVTDAALARLSELLPDVAAQEFDRVVLDIRQTEGLVVIAVPTLLWIGTNWLSALEHAVNVAFGTLPRRSTWRARLKVVGFLMLGSLFLGLSVLANTALPRLTEYREALGLPGAPAMLAGKGPYFLVLSFSYLIFFWMYKWLPAGRVRWRSAATGAAVALVLWETARRVFGAVLLGSPSFGLVSGTLTGFLAFLVWIYTAVAIVLLGAEVAALLNGRGALETHPVPAERETSPPA